MRYELSIDASYLDDDRWGVASGLREFLQNGRDAEIEQSAPLTVQYSEATRTISITNEGATLTRDALLLGRSTKRDRQDVLAGKWGEGLKLGALALVRSGRSVVIRNGGEVWTPKIEASEKFAGREVLVFHVATGRQERNRVRVEIDGIDPEGWVALQDCFLFLQKGWNTDKSRIRVDAGSLLLDPRHAGSIFLKGIMVQKNPKLSYGYDLANAAIDRDRRVIDQFDLNVQLREIWFQTCATRTDMVARFADMLDTGAADVEGVSDWNAASLPEAARQAITARFVNTYGADAVPVATLADSKDIEHLGKSGIVVRKQLQAILESVVGSFDTVKDALANEATKLYGWGELESSERLNLDKAILLIGNAGTSLTLNEINIADFRSPTLLGQYHKGQITIAKWVVADFKELLITLVHEVSHREGGDGDKGHVDAMQQLWGSIVAKLV